jgi:hypothetical protein
VGLAEIKPGVVAAVPVPLTATAVGALLALLPTVIVPPAAPAAVGLNATWKDTACPGVMSIGKAGPLASNAAEEEVNDERIAVTPPVFVTVKVCEAVLPTATLPKLTLAGLADITPGNCFCVPVPLTAIDVNASFVPLASRIVPFELPAALGAKETLIETVCPARSCIGKFGPPAVNDAPVELRPEIVTAVRPWLVTEKDWEELLPTCTLPKLKVVGVAVSGEYGFDFDPPLAPAASTDPA